MTRTFPINTKYVLSLNLIFAYQPVKLLTYSQQR